VKSGFPQKSPGNGLLSSRKQKRPGRKKKKRNDAKRTLSLAKSRTRIGISRKGPSRGKKKTGNEPGGVKKEREKEGQSYSGKPSGASSQTKPEKEKGVQKNQVSGAMEKKYKREA